MNLMVLTKISKFSLIASLSAFLSFASKNNAQAKAFFWLILGGATVVLLFAVIWESRDYLVSREPDEGTINTLFSGLQGQKPKRNYYLSAQARLEIVIALVTMIIFALVGSL